jgi:hypothetical protein
MPILSRKFKVFFLAEIILPGAKEIFAGRLKCGM